MTFLALLNLVSLLFATVAPVDARARWPNPLGDDSQRFTLTRLFSLPNGQYQAGHRGIDLRAEPGTSIVAPVSGRVHFAGDVVDRGVVTIEVNTHVLVSFEPVAPTVKEGEFMAAGAVFGIVSGISHCGKACLHIGVRANGDYVNPLHYFSVGRAQLLPLHNERNAHAQ